jgi:DNA recombination protein RmuC
METIVALLIGLLIGIAVGTAIGLLVAKARKGAAAAGASGAEDPAVTEARHQLALGELRAQEREASSALAAELASAQATTLALREQVAGLQEQHRELLERARAEAPAESERKAAESKVLQALAPVRKTLDDMQAKVAELEAQRSRQYGSLSEQLAQARISDEQLRSTTESLASALRSNSVRGVWGEAQLRRLVEVAGLTQYVDFDVQQSVHSDAGAGRPDMVIRLPGNKSIAVDAKVPLESYLEASQIPFTATGDEGARRKHLMELHVKAVRGHIDALSKKGYWQGLEASPEFVVAFIPSESLLSSALEADPALLDYSFNKQVALASPVNLWAVLKTISYTWQQQAVTDEARKLFTLGTTLYQRLTTLSDQAESLRKAIQRTVDTYNKFANSLETRVLVTARQFPGIDENKIIDETEPLLDSPRRLTALELEPSHEATTAADARAPHLLASNAAGPRTATNEAARETSA